MNYSDDLISGPQPQPGFFDKFGFFIFFVLGSSLIVGMKLLNVSQSLITSVAVLVMAVYAAIVFWSPRMRLNEDQAGDNLYYLGLLFTLVSLAFALWSFTPDTGARQVIGSFGIGLSTTIVGLALRVFFNQMRLDIIEIEREARQELAESANRLRSALDQMVLEVNDFHRSTQQATAETTLLAMDQVKKFTAQSASSLESVTEQVIFRINDSFKGHTLYANRLNSTTETMVQALERHTRAFDRLAAGTEGLDQRLNALVQLASNATQGLDGLSKKTVELRMAHAAIAETTAVLRNFSESESRLLRELEEHIGSFSASVTQTALLWENESTAALAKLAADGARGRTLLADEMQQLHESQVEALRVFTSQLEATTLSLVGAHREALAEELATSRSYTNQVHHDLVVMTRDLVNRLGGADPSKLPDQKPG